MLRDKLRLNKNSGSAMVFVILLFLIIIIVFTSVNFIFSSNLKMAVAQEENMRAHFLALSGIDITKSTLINPLYVDGSGDEKTMFNKIREDNIASLEDSITIEGEEVDIEVIYDDLEDIITITSTAKLKSGNFKSLVLELEFSGNQYREKWIR